MTATAEMMPAMRIVTVDAQQLKVLIREAVGDALAAKAAESQRPLSAIAAARVAKRRTSVVLAALEAGALPARRDGVAWRIQPADLFAWSQAGCPTSR